MINHFSFNGMWLTPHHRPKLKGGRERRLIRFLQIPLIQGKVHCCLEARNRVFGYDRILCKGESSTFDILNPLKSSHPFPSIFGCIRSDLDDRHEKGSLDTCDFSSYDMILSVSARGTLLWEYAFAIGLDFITKCTRERYDRTSNSQGIWISVLDLSAGLRSFILKTTSVSFDKKYPTSS